MFLQKIVLDSSKSYSTQSVLDEVVESLQLSYSLIPVITPYASKTERSQNIKNAKKGIVRLTIDQYNTKSADFDMKHVIVEDHTLFSDFGYSLGDIKAPVIILGASGSLEDSHGYSPLPICSCFIQADRNERFVAIYILSQIYSATIVTKNVDRVEMFVRIFKLDADVCGYDEIENLSKTTKSDCVIFLEGYRDVKFGRKFVIGRQSYGLEKFNLDLTMADKFVYRIEDVMKQLSPSVVRRKETFDYDRFENIAK